MSIFKRLSKNEFVSELPQFINDFLSIIEKKFQGIDDMINFGRGILKLPGDSTVIAKKAVLEADVDDVISVFDKSGSQIASVSNLGNARFPKITAGIGTTSVSDNESYIDRLFCDTFRTRAFSSSYFDVEQTMSTQYDILNVSQNNGVDIHNKKSMIFLNYNSMVSSSEKKFVINPSTLRKGMIFTFHLYACGESDVCQILSSDPMCPIRLMNGKSNDNIVVFKGHSENSPQFVQLMYIDEKNHKGLVVVSHSGVVFRNQN